MKPHCKACDVPFMEDDPDGDGPAVARASLGTLPLMICYNCLHATIVYLARQALVAEKPRIALENLLREAEECGANPSCMDNPQYNPSYLIEICKEALDGN